MVVSGAIALVGCGSSGPGPTAVEVERAVISKQAVDHWTSVIGRGAVIASVTDPFVQSPRQRALTLLINSNWLIGEAARDGLHPSHAQIESLVREQQESMPGGAREFQAVLGESGETSADAEFEARARWAAAVLAQRLTVAVDRRATMQVTSRAVTQFYRAHLARYHLREQRFYDLIERIPSRAEAVALAKRLGAGDRFAERASKERPFRPRTFARLPGQAIVYRAVFSAHVGVLTGPLPLQGAWSLFVLRRIRPPRVQRVSEVREAIEGRLLASARERVRRQLVANYRRRWVAQTDCRSGYVVQKCRQYAGPSIHENEAFAGY